MYCLFQTSMNLPADKAKLLKQYDDEKKWDLICDQVKTFFFKSELINCAFLVLTIFIFLNEWLSIVFLLLWESFVDLCIIINYYSRIDDTYI